MPTIVVTQEDVLFALKLPCPLMNAPAPYQPRYLEEKLAGNPHWPCPIHHFTGYHTGPQLNLTIAALSSLRVEAPKPTLVG